MLSIRETERRKSKYGPVVDVIVVGPRPQLEQLREMYDKPLSRDFWEIDREQWAWEQDGALRLGFHGSESEAKNAVKDAVKILGMPRPNPEEGPLWYVVCYNPYTCHASQDLQEILDQAKKDGFDQIWVKHVRASSKKEAIKRVLNDRRIPDHRYQLDDAPRKNPIVAWRCSHCDYEGTGDPPKRCPRCKR